jgi:uncharacterized membrane protein YraQ (UPF0718 family)
MQNLRLEAGDPRPDSGLRGVAARQFPMRLEAWTWAGFMLASLALLGAALRVWKVAESPALQNLALVWGSLLVEAVPFVLVGAVVSSGIEVFVPARAFERVARLPRPLQLPCAALMGLAFPVCECGSVPVARRLMTKGLSPAAATTFMLSAPIVNPVVIGSTVLAYSGRDMFWPMVLGRVGLGLAVAMAVGWTMRRKEPADLIRKSAAAATDHCHVGESRGTSFFGHLSGDFLFMGRYLVLGAGVAAALQTFVPQNAISNVAGVPLLSILMLMGLAFVLSLCSESDAFVAASFVQFGLGPQLAFLVVGPMLDTKLSFLYSGTFSHRFFRRVAIVVVVATFVGSLAIGAMFG